MLPVFLSITRFSKLVNSNLSFLSAISAQQKVLFMRTIDKINYYLSKQGKTGSALCEYLGVSNGVYSQWNTGRTSPRKSKLPMIAEYLGVTVDDLQPDEDIKKAPAEQTLIKMTDEVREYLIDLFEGALGGHMSGAFVSTRCGYKYDILGRIKNRSTVPEKEIYDFAAYLNLDVDLAQFDGEEIETQLPRDYTDFIELSDDDFSKVLEYARLLKNAHTQEV